MKWYADSVRQRHLANVLHNHLLAAGASMDNVDVAVSHLHELMTRRGWQSLTSDLPIQARLYARDNNRVLAASILSSAIEISAKHTGRFTNEGAVFTPSILARDMVAIAASYALAPTLKLRPAEVYSLLIAHSSQRSSRKYHDALRRGLAELTWYDPAVGTGVFLRAVVALLVRHGIKPVEAIEHLNGQDIDKNSLLVAAARIAHAARSTDNTAVRTLLDAASERLIRCDSLLDGSSESLPLFRSATATKQFDIVVGNPPFVRSERLPADYRRALALRYPEVHNGKADLYCYFLAHAVSALRPTGTLVFVTPASFMRSKAARGLRQYLCRETAVRALVDFGELRVFANMGLHTVVSVLSRGMRQSKYRTASVAMLTKNQPLGRALTDGQTAPAKAVSPSKGWMSSQADAHDVIDAMALVSAPLRQVIGTVYSGIKTGANSIFSLTGDIADRLLADPRSREFLRPLLRPMRIRQWRYSWDRSYLLLIPRGVVLPEGSSILAYVSQHREQLSRRSDVQEHATWYGLRECDYLNAFAAPKIVYPDIATECRFAFDRAGYMLTDGAFFINESDPLFVGLLNSSAVEMYFRARAPTIGDPAIRGRLRFKKAYVQELPVPLVLRDRAGPEAAFLRQLSARIIEDGASAPLVAELNDYVANLYHLSTPFRARLAAIADARVKK